MPTASSRLSGALGKLPVALRFLERAYLWLVQHPDRIPSMNCSKLCAARSRRYSEMTPPRRRRSASETASGSAYLFADRGWKDSFNGKKLLVRASRSRGPWTPAEASVSPDSRIRIVTAADLGVDAGGVQLREDDSAAWMAVADRLDVPRLGASGRELPGARIVTASLVTGRYEVRCHLVTAPDGWSLREGGDAVASEAGIECGGDAAAAWAVGDGVRSSVLGLFGYESGAVERYENTNVFGSHSAAPYLSAQPSSAGSVHVALHSLNAGTEIDPAEVVSVEVFETQVTARWARGSTVTVDLSALFGSGSTDATA